MNKGPHKMTKSFSFSKAENVTQFFFFFSCSYFSPNSENYFTTQLKKTRCSVDARASINSNKTLSSSIFKISNPDFANYRHVYCFRNFVGSLGLFWGVSGGMVRAHFLESFACLWNKQVIRSKKIRGRRRKEKIKKKKQ